MILPINFTKFEEFCFKYFTIPTILEADLKKLYENEEFNETVVKINFLFQRILFSCGISNRFREFLKVCNFVLFI
ncbi:hypothetical protein H311_01022 [Anncaliia algerae PRA109]|nr:hypothetical protein H311_01022 [Anncaliia algerae PRA109]